MKLWITDLDNTLTDTDSLREDVRNIGTLKLLPNAAQVFKVLVAQGIPIVILTKGDFVVQRAKVYQLGLTEVVADIKIVESRDPATQKLRNFLENKEDVFSDEEILAQKTVSSKEEKRKLIQDLLDEYGLTETPQEAIVVGDRLDSEVEAGASLGCTTVWFKYGRYVEDTDLPPEGTYIVSSHQELLDILHTL